MYVYDDEKEKAIGVGGPNKSSTSDDLQDKENSLQVGSDSGDLSSGDLSGAENQSSSDDGLYNPVNDSSTKSGGVKNFFLGSKRRKQATAGGGLGIFALILSFFGLTMFGGTGFEFIHIAQLLQHSHFSNQDNANNDRMGKLLRYMRSGDVGETRVGYLGSKLQKSTLKKLSAKGFVPSEGSTYKGWNIDVTNKESPYFGMSEEELKTKLVAIGIDPADININVDSSGKVTSADLNGKSGIRNYFKSSKQVKVILGEAGLDGVSGAVRARIFKKYALINWHPMQNFDQKANAKVADLVKSWKKSRDKFISTGEETTSTITDKTTGEKSTVNPEGAKSTWESIKTSKSLKAAGNTALVVGILCIIRSINDNVDQIRYAKDILPVLRLGTESITVGNQIMNGKDVNPEEMKVLSEQFNTVQQDGTKLNWSAAPTFQADSGQPPTGPDLSNNDKQMLSGNTPTFLNWINSVPGLGEVCGGVGGAILTGLGIVVGVVTDGISSLIQGALQAVIVGVGSDWISNQVAGKGINSLGATGPKWGNFVNYGSRYFSNSMAVQNGGGALTSSQSAELNQISNQISRKEFASLPLSDRLFNRYDYRSLASKIMDQTQSIDIKSNLINVASSLVGISKSIFNIPSKLFIGHTLADANSYKYPFPEFGYSTAELDNPNVEDPYANANYVATNLLDKSGTGNNPDYIKLAAQCFNDNVSKVTGDGGSYWDVKPGASGDVNSLNLYGSDYQKNNCSSPSGVSQQDWLRFRFFIYDTGIMEGYACTQGDNQSCQNDGFGETGAAASTNFDVNGAQNLAQSLSTNGTKIGLSLISSDGNQVVSLNDNNKNYGASITKSMLLVAYLNQVGSGSLSDQAKNQLTNMIENSDNASANWVYSQLANPSKQLKDLADKAGMTSFVLDTSDPTYILGQSQITAADFAKFFSKIDSLMDSNQKDFGLNVLSNLSLADQNGLLKAGLPGSVYSKEGWKPEPAGTMGAPYIVNQAAQFTMNGKTYGIAFTISGTKDQATGEDIIKQITQKLINGGGQ